MMSMGTMTTTLTTFSERREGAAAHASRSPLKGKRMVAYYNEIDPYAAQWLRNLISAEEIAPGDVDERDIRDVLPSDLRGYNQCHFFAGVGVWSHSLRKAGISDDTKIWTGSCPCQPFSTAGRKKGTSDERHLWPYWFHLIQANRPPIIFGEQVASKGGLSWFDLVSSDLEDSDYSIGAADLCAAGFGAPHIRQRLFFGASLNLPQKKRLAYSSSSRRKHEPSQESLSLQQKMVEETQRRLEPSDRSTSVLSNARLVDSFDPTSERDSRRFSSSQNSEHREARVSVNGFWRDADWLLGAGGHERDWRPVEPGTLPLANGTPNRVGRVRAYGNAIVSEVASGFIRSFVEASDMAEELYLIDVY